MEIAVLVATWTLVVVLVGAALLCMAVGAALAVDTLKTIRLNKDGFLRSLDDDKKAEEEGR